MPIWTPLGSGTGSSAINDGIATGQKATVAQFHAQDNQSPGGTAYGILTGGVAQLLNTVGNIDRQRETGTDGVAAIGIATGAAQFAMAFATTDATDNFTTGVRTFTPVAMSGMLNGVAWSIQVGSVLVLDSGASAESVLVTAVTATTFTCTTTKAHNGTVAPFLIAGFVYNQERDASGEVDGATGSGTAVAAEYEWNGNPAANGSVLANTQFDRARNLNAKGLVAGAISNNPLAANSASLLLTAAPTTLQPGQKILLDRAGANPETNYVAKNYMFGSTAVPLQFATQFSHAQNATVEWDAHAPLGPGLNGFLPDGIGIEEEALWDPVTQKFYIERAATQDGAAGANIVMENAALINAGGTLDRMRAVQGDAQAMTGVEASVDFLWNGASLDRPRSASADALATTGIAAEAAMVWNGATFDRLREATGDTMAAAGIAIENPGMYNGATFDRAYNNIAFSPVASAARTANGNSGALQTNFNARGVTLFVNVTAVAGTAPTLLVAIQGLDPVSAAYATLHAALANIVATGLYVIQFYPGINQSLTGYPATLARVLPRNWQIGWTIGGTTPSFTFSVGAQFTI